MGAVYSGSAEIAELLISAGMDVNAVTTADGFLLGENLGWKEGNTAFSMSEGLHQEDIIEILIEAGAVH